VVRRTPDAGVIFQSERGSQYCGHEFQAALADYKMKSSMSRKADCWDAPTQSLWGRLKVGRLYGRKFETRRQAMDEVMDWMTFYNHRRIHSTWGYVSPMQFEKSWNTDRLRKPATGTCRQTGLPRGLAGRLGLCKWWEIQVSNL
jgi:putative transposase